MDFFLFVYFPGKIDHFDRVFDRWHRKSRLCHGQIVQVDTMLVFQAKALAGLARLSFHDRKQTDYVSNEKVEPLSLKRGKTQLLYEDLYQCLESGTFMNYYSMNGLFILGASIRKRANELRYKDSSGKDCDTSLLALGFALTFCFVPLKILAR